MPDQMLKTAGFFPQVASIKTCSSDDTQAQATRRAEQSIKQNKPIFSSQASLFQKNLALVKQGFWKRSSQEEYSLTAKNKAEENPSSNNQMDNKSLTQGDTFRKIHRDLYYGKQRNPNFKPSRLYRVSGAKQGF